MTASITLSTDLEMDGLENVVANLEVITHAADLDENRVAYYLNRMVQTAQAADASPELLSLIQGDAALVQREYRANQKTAADLITIITAVFKAAQTYRARLSQALEAVEEQAPARIWRSIVDTIAENQGIPVHMAEMLASILLLSDNEIMAQDWTDFDGLIQFRDTLTQALNEAAAPEQMR